MTTSRTIDPKIPLSDVYPKLVRDKIPELLADRAIPVSMRTLDDDDEYTSYLLAKLIEEATELAHSKTPQSQIEELADVYEVLDAALEQLKLTHADITEAQAEKRQKRGGFKKRILLLSKP